MKPRIVISAVNLVEMGTLTILKECLSYAVQELSADFEIIALVNRRSLIDLPGIRYYEFPDIKSSYLKRIYYEYFGFRRLSAELKPFLWFSLYDMSANVVAERRAVYCHNPAPFYPLRLKEVFVDPKFALFNLFYFSLYRINIKSNNFIIVQQEWLRREFKRRLGELKMIVAQPLLAPGDRSGDCAESAIHHEGPSVFFYPSYPRMHKNMEVIGSAAELLVERGLLNFRVYLTMAGNENRYSRRIVKHYGGLSQIKFTGLLTRKQVYEYYVKSDCMIFPSKLETWGLPITEFKQFGKPMLVADGQYAAETVGDYDKAVFFDPDDPVALAEQMQRAMEHRLEFREPKPVNIDPPFCRGWSELFSLLLKPEAV